VKVGDRIRADGGGIAALAPGILHHPLRAGRILRRQWTGSVRFGYHHPSNRQGKGNRLVGSEGRDRPTGIVVQLRLGL
jgi:hypothetical protein